MSAGPLQPLAEPGPMERFQGTTLEFVRQHGYYQALADVEDRMRKYEAK